MRGAATQNCEEHNEERIDEEGRKEGTALTVKMTTNWEDR
jgi:hypothetical protein